MTEQSAAGSEEMASSSEQLGAQAQALRDLVGQFTTGNGQSGQHQAAKTESFVRRRRRARPRRPQGQRRQQQTAKAVAV